MRIARPDVYFDPAGDGPATVELVIAPPPAASEMPGWNDALNAEVRQNVEAAHRSMRANGMTFLGAVAVKNASFLQRAKSYEDRRQIVPKIAAINREVRVVMLRTYRAFHGLYRAALDAWRTGDREVVFPHGTWWMADFHGAAVAVAVPTVVLAGGALELETVAGWPARRGFVPRRNDAEAGAWCVLAFVVLCVAGPSVSARSAWEGRGNVPVPSRADR
jgi:hypothetical protein